MLTNLPTLSDVDYSALVRDVRNTVGSATPPGATVVVVSKGDEALVALPGRRGWHFPCDEAGRYAGYYPTDSEAAIAHLEELSRQGAEYLVLPATSFWWLEHYEGLARHLDDHYHVVLRSDIAVVYALASSRTAGEEEECPHEPSPFVRQLQSFLASLLPDDSVVAVASAGDPSLVALERDAWHFPRGRLGEYAGFSLPDTDAALRHAGEMATEGVSFLIVPSVESPWLEAYPDFLDEMARLWRVVTRQEHLGVVFDLTEPRPRSQ